MPTGDPRPTCECCRGTGYYGDSGPGIRGNREYHTCDQCRPEGLSAAHVLERAVEHWGLDSQIAMVAEECAELAVAAMHMLRTRHLSAMDAREDAFAEELADVEIMIEQMKVAGFAERVAVARARKMERLKARLDASIDDRNARRGCADG